MAKKTVAEVSAKKEFTMTNIFALWKKEAKKGSTYFSGKTEDGEWLRGFFNTNKKNPKEPDLRVYTVDSDGELSKEPYISMWCNASKSGKKYLTGKLGDKRVVGFINDSGNDKRPYVSVYYSEDRKQEKEEAPKETESVKEPF